MVALSHPCIADLVTAAERELGSGLHDHPGTDGASFHRLKFLDSAAPIGLGHKNIAFGIDCQSVAVSKFTDLVTRTPEA
jgi:hypothetical protein